MIDLSDAFMEGLTGGERPDYVDPWGVYGERAPVWAKAAWHGEPYFNPGIARTVDPRGMGLLAEGHELAAIGGKGSAKTFTMALRQLRLVQKYPGSKWLIASNTYAQAYNSAGVKLVEVANGLGIHFFHRSEMVLDGTKVWNVYVFPDFDSHVCIGSFDNIKTIEGSEWDGAWYEEIQDCEKSAIETANSRVRRGRADSSIVYAGMPDDVGHWMYGFFEANEIPLYEPPLRENEHNLPPKYMKIMRRYHGADFDRYVEGKRISLHRTPALRKFRQEVHVTSDDNPDVEFSLGHLCNYDPRLRLYVTFDFNVNPLCVSLWQMKSHAFNVLGAPRHTCPQCGEDLVFSHLLDNLACPSHGFVKSPVVSQSGHVSKDVLCQVDEFEMFGGTTEAICDAMLEKYESHAMGGLVIGDSTGSKTSTNTREPGRSDWSIIAKKFSTMRNMVIRQGVIRNRKPLSQAVKRGERRLTYSNPSPRDRIIVLDSFLVDDDGHPRMAFMPVSNYPSGGAAKSCGSATWTAEGKIDNKNDKLPPTERSVARTHFFDGVGYLVYHLQGGMDSVQSNDERNKTDISRVSMERSMRFAGTG